jgi:tripartite motif-containing protein 71
MEDEMKIRFFIVTVILLLVSGNMFSVTSALGEVTGLPTAHPLEQYDDVTLDFEFVDMWKPKFETWMNNPFGVAVSQDGDVYVTDSYHNRVLKFALNGVLEAEWGGSAEGDVEFDTPEGVAVDQYGFVYVLDWQDRVQKFDQNGTLVFQWGGPGAADGEFMGPRGITVDIDNHVYVADTANHRIQKFSLEGAFITAWGDGGDGDGEFQFPIDVAVDHHGDVYVADAYNHRIQKFSPEGVHIATWGNYGVGDGEFSFPSGITISSDGSIFVSDKNNHRIQKFSLSGVFEAKWGSEGNAEGQFSYPMGITLAPNGAVLVVDSANHRIQTFSSEGAYLSGWGKGPAGDYDTKIILDSHGRPDYMENAYGALLKRWFYDGANIVKTLAYPDEDHDQALIGIGNGHENYVFAAVQDFHDRSIQKFNNAGGLLTEWRGGQNTSPYAFWALRGVTSDLSGHVYVADTHVWVPYNEQGWSMGTFIRFQIHKFDPDGNLLISFGPTRNEDPLVQLQNSPLAIALDPDGENIYLVVARLHQIFKYNTTTGALVDDWGSYGQGEGEFNLPQGIATDHEGNVYVTDTGNHRVQKLTSNGTYITQWGGSGIEEGMFNYPHGISIGVDDIVLVTDRANHRIQVFTLDGQFITTWGSPGVGEGEFFLPSGIITFSDGHVYVMDTGNHRIQKFLMVESTDPPVDPDGLKIFLPLVLH